MKCPDSVRRWWYRWWHKIDTSAYGVKLPTLGEGKHISMARKGSYIDITLKEDKAVGIPSGRIRFTPDLPLSGFEIEYHYAEGDVTRHTATTSLRYTDIYLLVSGKAKVVRNLSRAERARLEELEELADALDAMHKPKYDWPDKPYRSPCLDECEVCDIEATVKGLRAAKTLMK